MNYIERAQAKMDLILENRRFLHQHPELGYELPETSAYVVDQLKGMGIEPKMIHDYGVTATIGKEGGKTILLRADMDALPIKEQSGLDFAATGDRGHCCGHDVHTTILLTVARLLKEDEDQLQGQVKFIFQPAEELLTGGGTMVEEGILENPKVDAAMGLHVAPHERNMGISAGSGVLAASANNFRILIKGVGSHGAMPYKGVDPAYIAAQIVIGTPEIIARELPFDQSAAITMGKIQADGAINVIPETALIEGTVRAFSNETREYIKKRLPDLVAQIAETYRGSAELEFLSDCPVLINDEAFTEETLGYMKEIIGDYELAEAETSPGSEDFAYYANEVPAHFFMLHTPYPNDQDEIFPVHHPQVRFNEDALPIGAGLMAHAAVRWLEENQ